MTYPYTDPVFSITTAALDCLGVAISGLPGTPRNVCYRVGLEIAHDLDTIQDLCCDGLAYVAIGDTWVSSTSFPEQDIVRQATARCPPPAWGQTIRMGIVRCVPVMGELGNMPTCTEWTTAAQQNMVDSIALRKASCCLRSWVLSQSDAMLGMSVVIQRQTQGPPLGGCVERSVNIDIQIPNCECFT
jgi:hypothetical protein